MLIRTENLTKTYTIKGEKKNAFHAVDGASIEISAGETVGLLGNSGSGKSTLGMMLAGLIRPNDGSILYRDNIMQYPPRRDTRRDIQILFQHPEVSFNPALPVIYSLVEPYKIYDKPYTKEKLLKDMEKIGLYEEHLYRYPSQLSGGELQRLALVRIMVLKPSFIILDEPTSMLDVISQAQILEILRIYQESTGAAFLLITHHKVLANTICHRIYNISDGIISSEGEKINN